MKWQFELVPPVYADEAQRTACVNNCIIPGRNTTDQAACIQRCAETFGGSGGSSNTFDITVPAPKNLPGGLSDIGGIISTVVGAAILIAAILAFLYLIWGGIQWITSGGDKGALEEARGRITAAIVGLVIVGAAWGIFKIIESIFGFESILGG